MKTSKTETFITGILIVLLIIFVTGHIAALINNGADLSNFSDELLLHIKEKPFDLQWHTVTFLASAMITSMCYLMMFVKTDIPKAEMKGIEHGSNDFQTNEELRQFLISYTTPIYSHDLSEFKSKESEKYKIQKKMPKNVDFFEDDSDVRELRKETKRIIAQKIERAGRAERREATVERDVESVPCAMNEEIPEIEENIISPYYYEPDSKDIFGTNENV